MRLLKWLENHNATNFITYSTCDKVQYFIVLEDVAVIYYLDNKNKDLFWKPRSMKRTTEKTCLKWSCRTQLLVFLFHSMKGKDPTVIFTHKTGTSINLLLDSAWKQTSLKLTVTACSSLRVYFSSLCLPGFTPKAAEAG